MEWLDQGIVEPESRNHEVVSDSLEPYDLHGPNARQYSAGARSPSSEKMRLLYPRRRSTGQFAAARCMGSLIVFGRRRSIVGLLALISGRRILHTR